MSDINDLLDSLREGGGCHPEQTHRAGLEQRRTAALLKDCLSELEQNYDLRLCGERIEDHPELRGLWKLIVRVRRAVGVRR